MEQAVEFTAVLVGAGEQIAQALRCLRTGTELAPHLVEIHRLENEGDRLQRDGVASLFAGGIDPMVVIRWKDIFESLEAAVDACETVAHVLEGITLKQRAPGAAAGAAQLERRVGGALTAEACAPVGSADEEQLEVGRGAGGDLRQHRAPGRHDPAAAPGDGVDDEFLLGDSRAVAHRAFGAGARSPGLRTALVPETTICGAGARRGLRLRRPSR